MFSHTLFLRIPAETTDRVLHQGKVIQSIPGTLVAEFVDPLQLNPGADVTLYTEFRGKFYQQGAAIVAVQQQSPFPILAFRKIGEPASAESRNSYRVSSAALNINALVANESGCSIVDLSPEGFAAITRRQLAMGSSVQVSFEFSGTACAGPARVQTLRQLPSGACRYGFLAVDPGMRKALGHLTAAVQRAQLRRLSRSAS